MNTAELLRKITTFPIISGGLAEDLLAGNFRSVFKGQGMEFDEARHYQWGDDARSIDWNASARFGVPFVKLYREERELSIMLLLDTSASMRRRGFVSGESAPDRLSPYEQALFAAALIALSAERTNQRVGALFFDRDIDRVFPPRKGRRHTMALLSNALRYQNSDFKVRGPKTDLSSNLRSALSGAGLLLKRRSLVVLVSDFFSLKWEQELGNLCHKHDVIALRITDPLETEMPDLGLVSIEDPETEKRITAPTRSGSFQAAWSEWHRERADRWAAICRRAGASYLELSSAEDAAAALFRFFGSRSSRSARPGAGIRPRAKGRVTR